MVASVSRNSIHLAFPCQRPSLHDIRPIFSLCASELTKITFHPVSAIRAEAWDLPILVWPQKLYPSCYTRIPNCPQDPQLCQPPPGSSSRWRSFSTHFGSPAKQRCSGRYKATRASPGAGRRGVLRYLTPNGRVKVMTPLFRR